MHVSPLFLVTHLYNRLTYSCMIFVLDVVKSAIQKLRERWNFFLTQEDKDLGITLDAFTRPACEALLVKFNSCTLWNLEGKKAKVRKRPRPSGGKGKKRPRSHDDNEEEPPPKNNSLF